MTEPLSSILLELPEEFAEDKGDSDSDSEVSVEESQRQPLRPPRQAYSLHEPGYRIQPEDKYYTAKETTQALIDCIGSSIREVYQGVYTSYFFNYIFKYYIYYRFWRQTTF